MVAQLGTYEDQIDTLLAQPQEHGFLHLITPNNLSVGQAFALYKTETNDVVNDMVVIGQTVDNLTGMKHVKYQQTYLDVPVEGMGCIEHFDDEGNLVFINAKLGVDLRTTNLPSLTEAQALNSLLGQLDIENYAWLDSSWEDDLQNDMQDNTATYYPSGELLFALDSYTNLPLNVAANRFKLCYKFHIVTTDNVGAKDYFVNAHDGSIYKTEEYICNNGPANIVGYGSRIIETEWRGWPWSNYRLYATDYGHNIHTKEFSNNPWSVIQNVEDDDDQWNSTHLTEQTVHYLVTKSWDYYKDYYGRLGMNNNNVEVRVKSNASFYNATYQYQNNKGLLTFGTTNTGDMFAWEPSVVGHEFNHGVDKHSSNLTYSGESGALDEAFADINGVVIQCLMLDNGATDWIIGNSVTGGPQRSLMEPKLYGSHYVDASGNILSTPGLGQPHTYNGEFFQDPSITNIDNGGVHVNSGVANRWFYILAQGASGWNDNNDYFAVNGINLFKAAKIVFLAQTEIMQSSSQFMDARLATIQAAIQLYGECSIEHQTVAKAWYAVGVGSENTLCESQLGTDEINTLEALIYPNPTNDFISIETGSNIIATVTIIDNSGRVVLENTNNNLSSSLTLDLNSINRGVYTLIIKTNNGDVYKQIIKE